MTEFWKGPREAEPVEALDAVNLEHLRAHASQAVATSPATRKRFADAGLAADDLRSRDDLRRLPVLTKPDIIADQAAHPPFGELAGCSPRDIVRAYVGPGPQTTFHTAADYELISEDAAWAFWTNGFRADDVVDVTIMYHWVIAGTLMDEGYRRIGCTTVPGGIGMVPTHLDNLQWLRATGLFAFPTFLEELAAGAQDRGIDPARDLHLRVCTIAGEMRSDELRGRMESFWGMKVREIYGGAEVPFIASECEEGAGMHLNPDLVVEVLDPDTQEPVEPGQPGLVVASETARVAQPVIRYSTGDIVAGVDHAPCTCGRRTPRLGRVLGRVGDIPRVKGLFLVPKQAAASLERVGITGRFQIVVDRPERRDTVLLRVEHDAPPDGREQTVQRAVAALKDGTRLTCDVELVPVGSLGDAPVVDDRRSL